MNMRQLTAAAVIALTALSSAGYGRDRIGGTSGGGDGWKNLDPGRYAAMDDLSFFKALVSIDFDGSYVKEMEKAGGIESMCAKYRDKISAEKRMPFYNMMFLKDALVEMGVSPDVVTAVLHKANRSSRFKVQKTTKDIAALLPELSSLCGSLSAMDAPPKEVAETLFREFMNESPEKRAEICRKFREKSERYVAARDVIVAAGCSRSGANAGLGCFAFKYTSGVPMRKFWEYEETFSKIDVQGLESLVPGCRRILEAFAPFNKPEKDVVAVLVSYMATPAADRPETLREIVKLVGAFGERRGNSTDAAAALHGREKAFKEARRRDE